MKLGAGFKVKRGSLKSQRFFGVEVSIRFYLLIFLFIVSIFLFAVERSYYRERESLIRRFKEFSSLAGEYSRIKEVKIMDAVNIENVGLLQEINNLVDSIGLRERVKYIKMTGGRELKELIEEGVDMRIDKLTMNEMINLLYRIENQDLSIKDIKMKKDFENPERIDLEIRVFMYKRGKKDSNLSGLQQVK